MVRHVATSRPENVFAVEVWSGGGMRLEETLARTGHLYIVCAAYYEARRLYPERRIMIRLAARVVVDSASG